MEAKQLSNLENSKLASQKSPSALYEEHFAKISKRSIRVSQQMSKLTGTEIETLLDDLENGEDSFVSTKKEAKRDFEEFLGVTEKLSR